MFSSISSGVGFGLFSKKGSWLRIRSTSGLWRKSGRFSHSQKNWSSIWEYLDGDWDSDSDSVEEVERLGGLGLGFLVKRLRVLMKAKLGEDEGFGGLGNQLSKKEPRLMDAIDGGG